MINIENITKRFPSVTALNGISLNVNEKEFFGLLGPNGAGKSTLMNLLIGYLDPDQGTILVQGKPVSRDNLRTRRQIGYVPQSIALYDDISAQDNLAIFGSFYHLDRRALNESIKEKLHSVQLYERRKDKVKTFSGGMKRRLNLIASLLHEPTILLCDEPTVGVDPQSRNAIFDYLTLLNRQGKTIIYTTHYMEEAERLCNRIAIIDSGTIIADGTLDQLIDKLPFDESIMISKNSVTVAKQSVFKEFGVLIDENDQLELKPNNGFMLSTFFSAIERHNISYKFIQLQKPSLEALFLHITGKTLRD